MMQRGVVAIEFSLILIPILMLVTGIIEFGRGFWYYDALAKSTRDAARYLSDTRANTSVALDDTIKDKAKQMVVDAASYANVPNFYLNNVVVTCLTQTQDQSNCDSITYVKVQASYEFTIGGWVPVYMPIGAKSWTAILSPSTTMRYMQ